MNASAHTLTDMQAGEQEWIAKTVPQVAAMFGISGRTLWDYVSSGEIESFKLGRTRLIPREAAYAFRDRLIRETRADRERIAATAVA
jgi:excisionase family DNA binding protein